MVTFLILNLIYLCIVCNDNDVLLMKIYFLVALIFIGCMTLWMDYHGLKSKKTINYGGSEILNLVIEILDFLTVVPLFMPMTNNVKFVIHGILSVLFIGLIYIIKRSEKKLRMNVNIKEI